MGNWIEVLETDTVEGVMSNATIPLKHYSVALDSFGVPPPSLKSILFCAGAGSCHSLVYGLFPRRETTVWTSLAKWWLDDRRWHCDQ